MAKRSFVLMTKTSDGYENTSSTFTGRSPAIAARKAAVRGHKDIYLRETKDGNIRHYKGRIEMKTLKKDIAFKKKGEKIKEGKTEYIGIVHRS